MALKLWPSMSELVPVESESSGKRILRRSWWLLVGSSDVSDGTRAVPELMEEKSRRQRKLFRFSVSRSPIDVDDWLDGGCQFCAIRVMERLISSFLARLWGDGAFNSGDDLVDLADYNGDFASFVVLGFGC